MVANFIPKKQERMKRIRPILGLLAGLGFVLLLRAPALGAFGPVPVLSEEEARPGETVEISLSWPGDRTDIAAFLLQVEFDPTVLSLRRSSRASSLREGETAVLEEDGVIRAGFLMGDAPFPAGESFSFRFQLAEDAPAGETWIRVSVLDPRAADGSSLEEVSFLLPLSVLPLPSSDASLVSLAAESGQLSPAFSPDITEYALSVPFEVAQLSFSAQPADGAVCRVNRKNLGAGGSDTLFLFTVTAEDGKTRREYRVTVHRGEKQAAEKPSPAPKPTAVPRPTATPKPMATPRAAATPKPTGTPKSAAATPGPTATPKPSPKAAAELSPKDMPPPEDTTAPTSPAGDTPLSAAVETPSPTPILLERDLPVVTAGSSVVVRSSSGPSGFFFWAFLFLGAVFVLSGPLARMLGKLVLRPVPRGKEDPK